MTNRTPGTGFITEAMLTTYAAAKWQPTHAYSANDLALAPDGRIIQRNANGTSRASYDATEQGLWTAVSGGTGAVASVAGKTGVVTLAKGDVGLGNVDNVSDANKPVSTAQAIAIGAKADASTTAKDLPDTTVAGASGQLAAGVTSNVAAGGAYTSPALDGAVATPPKRWAIKAAATGSCTITLPDAAGVSSTITVLAGEVLTLRQKSTSGWGTESGNKPLTQLDNRFQGARAPYLGPVATRCRIPSRTVATATFPKTGTWSRHTATDDIAATQLLYSSINGVGEVSNSAGPGTVEASVEYPAGTITRVTFGGTNTGTIPANDHMTSDLVTLTTKIPAGATFWVYTFVTWTGTNTPLMDDGLDPVLPTASSREASAFGSGIVNQVLTGTRVATGHNPMNSYRPTMILGMTQRPTFALVGDSRTRENLSWESTIDAEGLRGFTEMVLGGRWGYVNLGVSTDSYTNVLSATGNNYIKRLALSQYCTHVLDDYGTNSVQVVSTAQMQTDVTNFRAKFAGKVYYKTTLVGQVTGRTVLADGSDQTISGTLSNLTTHNDWVRQGAGGVIDGYIELEDLLTLRRGSGKWKPAQRIVSDAGMTSGSNVITSAGWNSDDAGKLITILGAGAAGAALTGIVGTVTPGTSATLLNSGSTSAGAQNASTTVSAATMGIGLYTGEGIHQTREATKLIRDSNAHRPLLMVK